MILSKDQINRYLRHIIIPEISGAGQKKIIESKVLVYSSSINEGAPLIYYLAASGVGHISCYFNDKSGYEDLYSSVKDLNNDVILEFLENDLSKARTVISDKEGCVIHILIGKYENLTNSLKNISSNTTGLISIVAAFIEGWKGIIQVFNDHNQIKSFLGKQFNFDEQVFSKEGSFLSSCLIGTFIAIECIKLCLDAGTEFGKTLSFDLLTMQFNQLDLKDSILNSNVVYKKNSSENQIPVDSERNSCTNKLAESKVLIVGAGGLGSPNVYALANLGLGTIGLVDYDNVEISNLNRQIIHSTSRMEMSKVKSAEIFVKGINSNTNIITYNTSLNVHNVMDVISQCDVIVDALDNYPDRYLLNDACYFAGKPLVDAAAVKTHGLIMTILPGKGPCYRCAFPSRVKPNGVMSCAEAGVLGPVPGAMGFIQAAEVIKLLLNIGDIISSRLIYYEALDCDFITINVNKSDDCELCGTNPTITNLIEYKNSCEIV